MLAAGYRPSNRQSRWQPNNATYVSFGNRGDKVVVTYHGDHAYSFSTLTSAEDAQGTSFCGVGPAPYFANRPPERGSSFHGHPQLAAPTSPVKIVQQGCAPRSTLSRERVREVGQREREWGGGGRGGGRREGGRGGVERE